MSASQRAALLDLFVTIARTDAARPVDRERAQAYAERVAAHSFAVWASAA